MTFEFWHYWVIAAFCLLILEIFIPGFIVGSLGIGCLLAAFGAFLGLPLWVNILLAIGGFFVGILMLKPMLKRMGKTVEIRTNADGLIGKVGKVTERIDPIIGSGRVHVDGDDWKAISVGNVPIEPGAIVEIIALESIVVTVRKVQYHENQKSEETQPILKSTSEKKGLILTIGNRKEIFREEDILCFYSNQKITCLITSEGKQVVTDESLEKLESTLGTQNYFRANRQFILTPKVVKEYRTDSSGKLDVYLKPMSNLPSSISVSRLKAHSFRKWIEKGV
jgi:membrane protein implicated in regulation of membrane protease activity